MQILADFAILSAPILWFIVMFLNWKVEKISQAANQMQANNEHVLKDLYVHIELLNNEIEKLRSDLLG